MAPMGLYFRGCVSCREVILRVGKGEDGACEVKMSGMLAAVDHFNKQHILSMISSYLYTIFFLWVRLPSKVEEIGRNLSIKFKS